MTTTDDPVPTDERPGPPLAELAAPARQRVVALVAAGAARGDPAPAAAAAGARLRPGPPGAHRRRGDRGRARATTTSASRAAPARGAGRRGRRRRRGPRRRRRGWCAPRAGPSGSSDALAELEQEARARATPGRSRASSVAWPRPRRRCRRPAAATATSSRRRARRTPGCAAAWARSGARRAPTSSGARRARGRRHRPARPRRPPRRPASASCARPGPGSPGREAEAGSARRAARAERDEATLRARLLLDTVVDAAAGLRRELALPPAAGRRATGSSAASRRGRRARARRRVRWAPTAPRCWSSTSRCRARGCSSTATTSASPPGRPRRWRLQRDPAAAALAPLVARTGAETTVVFDAQHVGARPVVAAPRGVKVVFSPEGVIADDVIRDLVAAEPHGRVVVVVTGDREVGRRRAPRRGRACAASQPARAARAADRRHAALRHAAGPAVVGGRCWTVRHDDENRL